MGEIVAAMATCHAPYLLSGSPEEKDSDLDLTAAAMRELGTILDETQPDVLLFMGSDHLETFSMTCLPTFAIVAGSTAVAEYAGHEFERPIHRELAEHLLDQLVRSGFDMTYSEDALLGHTYAVPFDIILGNRDIPVVPFHTNVYLPPLPSLRRCEALGRRVAEIMESRPERFAILASGGMSHFPGTERYPEPAYDFDYWLLGELEKGNTDALLEMTVEQLDEVGNTELLNWAVMFGAIGKRKGELLQYTPTWHHGHGMVLFIPERGKRPSNLKKVGRYDFRNKGFEFYAHPDAEAYKLNKLLYAVRTESGMRARVIDDFDGVTAEWALTSEEKKAAEALIDVKQAGSVSDFCRPLVKAGVHPLQALMALHVIYVDHCRRSESAEDGSEG